MENLDPATIETQQTVVSEIFKHALATNQEDLTLSTLLQSYDRTIGKHGISASDLAGIQIYRALLHWSRQPSSSSRSCHQSHTTLNSVLQPLHATPEKLSRPSKTPNFENFDINVIPAAEKIRSFQQVHKPPDVEPQSSRHQIDIGSQVASFLNNTGIAQSGTSPAVSALPSSRRSRSSSPTPYFPEWAPLAFPARAPSPAHPQSRQSSSQSPSRQHTSRSRSPSPPLILDPALKSDHFIHAPGDQSARNNHAHGWRMASPPLHLNASSEMTQLPAASSLVTFEMNPDNLNEEIQQDSALRDRTTWFENVRIDDFSPAPAFSESFLQMASNPLMRPIDPIAELETTQVGDALSGSFTGRANYSLHDSLMPIGHHSSGKILAHSFIPSMPLVDAASMTETLAISGQDVLAEAFQYRFSLRCAFRDWQKGSSQCVRQRLFLEACKLKHTTIAFKAWQHFVGQVADQCACATSLGRKRIQAESEALQYALLRSWCIASRRRANARKAFALVRLKFTQHRLQQWADEFQNRMTRSRGLQRVLLLEWRAAVLHCRKIRHLLEGFRKQKAVHKRVQGLCWWMLMCRKLQAGRELLMQATTHGRRTQLTRGLATWHIRSRQGLVRRQIDINTSSLARDHARSAALARWHVAVAPCTKLASIACSCRALRRQRLQRNGISSWREKSISPPTPGRYIRKFHQGFLQRKLRFAFGSWRNHISHTRKLREDFEHRLRIQWLRQVWGVFCDSHVHRQIELTHKAWADFFWIRSLQRRGWVGWRAWLLSFGRVSMMEDEAHIIASWHWLRLSTRESSHGPREQHVPSRGGLAHYSAPSDRSALSTSIAELFWGGISFAVHPHRFRTWNLPLLAIFARALLRRLFHHWFRDMNLWKQFHHKRYMSMKRTVVVGWCNLLSKRKTRTLHQASLAESIQTNHRRMMFLGWQSKVVMRTKLRLRTHDFVMNSSKRTSRRALTAWHAACARQGRVLAVGQTLLVRSTAGLQAMVFQAMVSYLQQSQQSNIFLRLSALYLRKCSLIRGIRTLKVHVRDQAHIRMHRCTRRHSMQRSWLRQWHQLHHIRKDLIRRTAAARTWSQSKRKLFAWFAWYSWMQAMKSERRRIMIYRQARSSRIATCRLHAWHHFALEHSIARRRVSSVRQAIRCRRACSGLQSWHAYSRRRGIGNRRARSLASQRLEEAMAIWKKCVQHGRAFDNSCIGAINLQRFKLIVAAWRREVFLSHLVRHIFTSRTRQRLKQCVHTFREHSHRKRIIRIAHKAAQRKCTANVVRLCISGWIDHVRQKGCWRICVEVMRVAIINHLMANCFNAWLQWVKFFLEVHCKGQALVGSLRTATVTRSLATFRKQAVISQRIRRVRTTVRSQILHAYCSAWCKVSKSRGRCHRCSAQLQQRLQQQRRRMLWHYWQAQQKSHKQILQVFIRIRSDVAQRRLRACFADWCILYRRMHSLQLRIASSIIRRQQDLKKRTLRCLALWCVYCSEREERLARLGESIIRAVLKLGFQSWVSIIASRQDKEAAVLTALLHRNIETSRFAFNSWAATTLKLQRLRSLNAMGEHFMKRCLTSKAWLAWLGIVRKEDALRTKETAVRRYKLERIQMNVWAVWRCRIAERWVLGERRQEAKRNCRHVHLRRGMRWWLDCSRSRHLVREAAIAVAKQRGWHIVDHAQVSTASVAGSFESVPSGMHQDSEIAAFPSLLMSMRSISKFYETRLCLQASLRMWRELLSAKAAHAAHLEMLLGGATAQKNACLQTWCQRAWRGLTQAEVATRENKLTHHFAIKLSTKFLRPWLVVAQRIQQSLARLRQRQRLQGSNIFGLVMHHWIGHVLFQRSLSFLAEGVRQKCARRRAQLKLRAWSDEADLKIKARDAEKKLRMHYTKLKFRAWSAAVAMRRKSKEHRRKLCMRHARSKLRIWSHDLALGRAAREIKQKLRMQELRCAFELWQRAWSDEVQVKIQGWDFEKRLRMHHAQLLFRAWSVVVSIRRKSRESSRKLCIRHARSKLRIWSHELALRRIAVEIQKKMRVQELRCVFGLWQRAWSDEVVLKMKARDVEKRLRMHHTQLKFRAWSAAVTMRKKSREHRRKLCMRHAKSKLRIWSHDMALTRIAGEIKHKLRMQELRYVFGSWQRHCSQKKAHAQLSRALTSWREWARWQVAARMATLRLLTIQIRHLTKEAFHIWVSVAKMLVELETRRRLQIDDLRRRRRSLLCMSIITTWHQETTRALRDSDHARATKVLMCWHLYAQEQILLRRYLGQCSMAGFRGCGRSASSSGNDVHAADFQSLYEQMAAHRWDLMSVMSD